MDTALRKIFESVERGELSRDDAMRRIVTLRGEQRPSATDAAFSRQFSLGDAYVRDHLVQSEPVLLGVTYVSLALDAWRRTGRAGDACALQRVTFVEPMRVRAGVPCHVSVEIEEHAGETKFRALFTHADGAGGSRVPAHGEYMPAQGVRPRAIDLEADLRAASAVVPGHDLYGRSDGIEHGPSLHTVRKVHVRGDRAIGELALSDALAFETTYESFHPALLDGAILSAAVLLPEGARSKPFIPIFIGSLTQYAAVPARCFSVSRLVKANDEVTIMDMLLVDASGSVLVDVRGFTCKRIRATNSSATAEQARRDVTPAPLAGHGVEARASDSTDPVESYVVRKLQGLIGSSRPLEPKTNFMELGIDSNQLVGLAASIKKEVGVQIYPTVFFEYPNLSDLTAFFAQEYGEKFRAFCGVAVESTPKPTPVVKPVQSSAPRQADERIAIIGMAGRWAEAPDLEAFWRNTALDRDVVREVPLDHWDYRPWFEAGTRQADKTYSKWGSFVSDVAEFDAEFFGMSRKEAELMDPQQRLLLQTLYHAAENAGYGVKIRGSRAGVFVGCCFYDYAQEMGRVGKVVDPHDGTGNAATMLANRPSFFLDLRGPSLTIDTACSSSLVALDMASDALRRGKCDLAFVAGVNLLLSSWHYRYFCSIGALSPTGRCHTFDERADGYVPGEAVGVCLLKPLSAAIEDGDRIHAVITGSAVNHGGYTPSPTAPNTKMETEVMREAWQNAGVDPTRIGYIEAHGTGTPLGDPIEINAIKAAFAAHTAEPGFCAIGSAKAQVGHTEGAAGITGVIRTVLAMQNETIPALHGFRKLNPYISLEGSAIYIPAEKRHWPARAGEPRRAGVSSFGFGGTYAHVVLEEAPPGYVPAEGSPRPHVLIGISARNERARSTRVTELRDWLAVAGDVSLADLAFTLNRTRAHWAARHAFVVQSVDELRAALDAVLQGEAPQSVLSSNAHVKPERHAAAAFETTYRRLVECGDGEELRAVLRSLGALYIEGAEIDWARITARARLLDAPLYPFATEHCWFDHRTAPPTEHTATPHVMSAPPVSAPPVSAPPVSAPPVSALRSVDRVEDAWRPERPTASDVCAKGVRILSDILLLPESKIDRDAELTSLGVDSVMTMQFVMRVNEVFGLRLTAAALYDVTRVGDVLDRLTSIVEGAAASTAGSPVSSASESVASPASAAAAEPPVRTADPVSYAPESPSAPERKRLVLKQTGVVQPPSVPAGARYVPILSFNTAGHNVPLFLVHPGGAGAEAYIKLSTYLDKSQPLYAIESYNLYSGEPLIRTVTELAAVYLRHLREAQPRGPYYLGGWSRGGMIAFEIAQQLRASGEQVGTLYLLDTYVMNEREKLVALDNVIKHSLPNSEDGSFRNLLRKNLATERIANIVYDPREFPGRTILYKANQPLQAAVARDTMRQVQVTMHEGIPRAASDGVDDVIDNLNAFINEDTIADFNALGAKPDNGWSRYIPNLLVRVIEGNHFSIMGERTLRPMVEHIQADLLAASVSSRSGAARERDGMGAPVKNRAHGDVIFATSSMRDER
ncbi:beta-ketoacyl synthase N-terminal-like domain-containing protein [Sorangium sp. So ce429]